MRLFWRSDSDTLHNSQLKLITFAAAAARIKSEEAATLQPPSELHMCHSSPKKPKKCTRQIRFLHPKTPFAGFKKARTRVFSPLKNEVFTPLFILLILTRHIYELPPRESGRE